MNIASPPRNARPVNSIFCSRVVGPDGQEKRARTWRANLRTTSADARSGYDWQSKAMGGDSSVGSTGTSTAAAATTLTNTGASWTTNQWAGHMVVTGAVYAVVLSNTATILTVDQWYTPTSPSKTAAATPATGTYVIVPGAAPAWWIVLAHGSVAATLAASDTSLANEIVAGSGGGTSNTGLARDVGAWTHTSGTNSYQIAKLFTSTQTSTVQAAAVVNAASGGSIPFESVEPNPPTLVANDTLQQNIAITY